MILQYIPPKDIKQVWLQIRPSLNDMATKSGEWIVEDAYVDLMTGTAQLYLAIKNSYFQGYFITQVMGNTLHIWAVYGKNTNLFEEGMVAIKELAKKQNLTKITFNSIRQGWNKIAPQLGFKPKTWELNINA